MVFEEAEKYAREDGRMCLWSERARRLYDAAASTLHLDGEFWECGTYRGGSARLLALLIEDNPRPLRLFDTFRGFANVTPGGIDGTAADGEMFYKENAAEDILQFIGKSYVSAHPGAIPKGFVGFESSKIAFAHLDVDLYQPTREALKFILPRMVPGGIIILDDCGDKNWPGVKIAADETRGDHPLEIFPSEDPEHREYCGYQGRIQL